MKVHHQFLILIFCTTSTLSFSQNTENQESKHTATFGVSTQIYSSGIIPTINYEFQLTEQKSIQYRLGLNIINRQDFSNENDEEKGFGFGGTMGYRCHFLNPKGEFIIGLNLDLWNTWIDWKNNVNQITQTSGNTYTLVLQPWLEIGYFFKFRNTSKIGLAGGFGREINVITNGKDVAEGWIGSLSVQYYFARRK